MQVLDLRLLLADDVDETDFLFLGSPGVADELRIEFKDPQQALRIGLGGGFPLDQAEDAIDPAEGIDIGQEVPLAQGERPAKLHLKVRTAVVDQDSLVFAELVQQLLPLVEHLLPAVTITVFEFQVFDLRPVLGEEADGVGDKELTLHGHLEDPAEDEARLIVSFLPAVQVVVLTLQRALQVGGKLCVAVMILSLP
jgi:hypothetical protein